MNEHFLRPALRAGSLRSVDAWLATHLTSRGNHPDDDRVALAIAALSRASADGDVCIDLAALACSRLFAEIDSGFPGIEAPPLETWLQSLRRSALVSDAGERATDSTLPLVLDANHRLYLRRYRRYEQDVAGALRERLGERSGTTGAAAHDFDRQLSELLPCWFPDRPRDDRQQLGAALAVLRRLAIISGGPGTGKTSTVARLLGLRLALDAGRPPLIRLAAPTGKAAARLTQSIRQARSQLRDGRRDALVDRIPEEASTLHRLLGAGGDGRTFRHGPGNPLALDVLVVDEASMIDLALMAQLLSALPAHAQLVLLGDRDQLASVEAGNVLGDLCNHGVTTGWSRTLVERLRGLGLEPPAADDAATPMADSLVVLTHSHRFAKDSGIGRAALAINAGDAPGLRATAGEAVRENDGEAGVTLAAPGAAELPAFVDAEVCRHWQEYLASSDIATCHRRFDGFRFLCALREGEFGVTRINRCVEQSLARRGIIDLRGVSPSAPHYAGRPLLVTRNDYGIGLFNGDIGLVLPDATDNGRLRAFFVQPGGEVRSVALDRLPPHETAFAMTVHKSQGSEFDRVVVVLPSEMNPVLTRELVYTGVTRARTSAALWAAPTVIDEAVRRKVVRASGLRDALWSAIDTP